VKTSNSTTGLFAALLLASPLAAAEPQYPAADFEPVIISRDADLIAKHSQDSKERELAEQAKLAKRSQVASTSVSAAQPSKVAQAASLSEGAASNSPSIQKESSMENFPIALVVFALAGFVFWSTKRPGAKAQKAGYEPAVVSSGVVGGTGVAKYLSDLDLSARKAAGTSVARYLKVVEATAQQASETGVAKYIKTADLSPKKGVETGVEKNT